MSHEIWELDRPVFGRGKAAWHRLGQVVPGSVGTAAQAAAQALAWGVDLEAVLADAGNGQTFPVPDASFTVRDDLDKADKRRILGVVKGRYQPIQNRDIAELVDALAGEAGADVETVGSLQNGRQVWFLAKNPEALQVKDDRLERYILVRSSHDGTAALEVRPTDVRVVCQNTLSLAVAKSDASIRIRHTASGTDRLRQAVRAARSAAAHQAELAQTLRELADRPLPPEAARAFLIKLFCDDPKASDQSRKNQARRRSLVGGLYNGRQLGGSQAAVRGTAYGMLQAVAEYADHHQTVRTSAGGSKAEARMTSVLWGSAASLKQKALDSLIEGIDWQATERGSAADSILAGLDLSNLN